MPRRQSLGKNSYGWMDGWMDGRTDGFQIRSLSFFDGKQKKKANNNGNHNNNHNNRLTTLAGTGIRQQQP